jgi:hypothetical protein
MRVVVWSCLVLAIMSISIPAQAQTYDPRYPVCMTVYDDAWGGEWIDCSYTSLPQCKATASGRAAMCYANPYFVQAPAPAPSHRRHRRAH